MFHRLRFFDLEFKKDFFIFEGLQKVYGLGVRRSLFVLLYFGWPFSKKFSELNSFELNKLNNFIKGYFLVGNKLVFVKKSNLLRHVQVRSRKGLRTKAKLPLRGQRTKSNARTCRR